MIALYTLAEMRIMDRRMTGSALTGKGERTMSDREKVIKEFEHILNEARGDYLDFADITVDFGDEILAMLKEQEEQKQKWLKQIADAQIAVCPTGIETEEGLAKRTGKWIGLQMAWDILTKGR